MKRLFSPLLMIAIAGASGYAQDLENCELELTMNAPTKNLAAYLVKLSEHKTLSSKMLLRLADAFGQNKTTNPISESDSRASSALLIHREKLERLLSEKTLQFDLLREQVLRILEAQGLVDRKRVDVKKETETVFRKIELSPVPGGQFVTWGHRPDKAFTTTLTHAIEAMTTPVTQKMWVDVMGENPSSRTNRPDAISVEINGKPVKLRPDHPVDMVTWWSAVEFANRLSIKHGLKPAYILKGWETAKETRAENGTLDLSDSGEVSINAPDGNIYQAEGFRLPTETEYSYLLRLGGTRRGKFFELSNTEILDYGWFWENSKKDTYPVGERLPFIINGQAFYDLIGNVAVWTHDGVRNFTSGKFNPSPSDPRSDYNGYRMVRGFSWATSVANSDPIDERAAHHPPHVRSTQIGLRLVRTLK